MERKFQVSTKNSIEILKYKSKGLAQRGNCEMAVQRQSVEFWGNNR